MHLQDQGDLPARTKFNTLCKKKTEPRISVMYHCQVKITGYMKKQENLIKTWREKKVNRNRSRGDQMLELEDNNFKIPLINMLQNLLEKMNTVGKEMENFRKDVETLKKNQK